jgi:hypothetical protein
LIMAVGSVMRVVSQGSGGFDDFFSNPIVIG